MQDLLSLLGVVFMAATACTPGAQAALGAAGQPPLDPAWDGPPGDPEPAEGPPLKLLPYPQEVESGPGGVPLGPADYVTDDAPSATEQIAMRSLNSFLPEAEGPLRVRLGSVAEGYEAEWLTRQQRSFLHADNTSPEAYVLTIAADGITVVGKGRWGMLYGVQTVNQLAREAARDHKVELPCLTIRDWPDMPWRCLSPAMTWYSGFNRLEGYDLCNWTLDEWKWLVDWSLLHKFNCWALCMYGYWPFSLPGYEESTLQVDSLFFNPATGQKEPRRFVHRNIQREFLPELIRYAHERGLKTHAYIGKNSFNGGYLLHHPEANAGGAAELLPFAPGVHEYWDAFLGRILQMGFDGFVFEDPEAYHVPDQNDECYRTFWEPWAETYGFHSREEVNANEPPLGVHVEYYTWLFRQFDHSIQRQAERLGRQAEIYLISHILLSRIMGECPTQEERAAWFDTIDERHGRRVPFIVAEANEAEYAALLGGDRVASLGGRGGSCLSAWRRMTGVNNNMDPWSMGASVNYERDCQRRIHATGGRGAMAYVFEWRNCEIYGYIGAQHLWRADGIPGIDNEDQVGFLDYAYRVHYGAQVGELVARALDTSPCVNDAMVLEDVHGAQYPETGQAYHREYQLLAAQADEAVKLAWEAYRLGAGREPDLEHSAYAQEAFRWQGFEPQADHLFKEETLRWLCVELRRAQLLCEAALAHRRATRLAAEGARREAIVALLDQAAQAAEENQRLYQINFDDDYHWNEALCVRLVERLREMRSVGAEGEPDEPTPRELTEALGKPLFIPWEELSDQVPPSREAAAPGLYLSVHLGLNELRDYSCHGVVFTVQVYSDGAWQVIFRRTRDKNSRDWEHWDIPLDDALAGRAPLGLRFLTDSYSRARNREAASWEWALWGNPELARLTEGGDRHPAYEFTEHLDDVRPFVVLDADGQEREFDGDAEDSSGATFKLLEPGPVSALQAGEGAEWQWVQGFARPAAGTNVHHGGYRSYLGVVPSWWAYAEEGGEVAWETEAMPEQRETAVVFIGGTDYTPGQAELWCDGNRLLEFDTGRSSDARWREGDVELRYYHGADTRDERTTYGLSGVFVLRLPPALVTPGQSLALSVKMTSGGHAWFMVHGFGNPMQASERVVPPGPRMPTICAFTPHEGGAYGVTGADFEVEVSGLGKAPFPHPVPLPVGEGAGEGLGLHTARSTRTATLPAKAPTHPARGLPQRG